MSIFPLWTLALLVSLTVPGVVATANSTLPSRRECGGPFKHHIHLHVYHIAAKSATTGITNKNAADSLGDIAFIFGSTGVPTPRGIEEYYDGIVEMAHLSVSSWGDYLQCNHPDGSTVYSCKCPAAHSGACDMKRPGKEQNSHSNGHLWYSFPHAGQGKYWDYEHFGEHRGCRRMAFHASCVIDNLAKKAGCKIKCSPKTASECVTCVNKLSSEDKLKVWDDAIWDGGCSDLNSPSDPLNRRRTSRRRSSLANPAEHADAAGVALVV